MPKFVLQYRRVIMTLDIDVKSSLFLHTKADVEVILSKYGRDKETAEDDVRTIRQWLETQPHIPQPYPSDRLILSFLVQNKFSIEKTKDKIDWNYTIKSLMPDFYRNKYPSNPLLQKQSDIILWAILPKLTPDKNRVVIWQMNGDQTDNVLRKDLLFPFFLIMLQVKSLEDLSLSSEYILDFSKASFKLMSQITPMDVKKSLTIFEKVYSTRIRKIVFVNMKPVANYLLDISKPLLPKKLKDRIFTFQSSEELKTLYPREMLPVDFGGCERSLAELKCDLVKLMASYDEYFKVFQDLEVDETVRPKKLLNDEVLGYHGNFKQLSLD